MKTMAKIFKTDQQEEALKSIVENLKTVEIVNKLLDFNDIENSKVRIMGNVQKQKVNEQFDLPYTLLIPTLKDYRKTIVKDTFDKSKKFHIELEDREVDILNNVKEKKDGDVNTNENTNVDTTEDENEINELERMMEEENQNF
jgi:hypothetical protein